jgi:ribonuclease-3
MTKELAELEQSLGFSFKDKRLLWQALTHRSYLNENPNHPYENNERLEFLGDAVLELVVTEHLYKSFKNPEGELTSWRAALVNAKTLAEIADKLRFSDFLLLSRGEKKDTGRARHYILANTIEAIIGAMYLDSGYGAAKKFIDEKIISTLGSVLEEKLYKDPKSSFQESAQEHLGITPVYEVLAEWGPDHAKRFKVGVYLGKELVGEGEGASKQDAQQEAARQGLHKFSW